MIYGTFAEIYDEFMDTVDYASWKDRLLLLLRQRGIKDGLVLDLACGTGTMTELLAQEGYDMIGVDASGEMLQCALAKRDLSGSDILYLCQEMTSFELYGTVRAVICTCDSINYITEEKDLLKVFRLVNNYLDPAGIFLFDFNTPAAYTPIGSSTIAETRDTAGFIWENAYDAASRLNECSLTLFTQEENGLYARHEEMHLQRAWDCSEIRTCLSASGLVFEAAFDGYSDDAVHTDSSRILIMATENGK